VTTTTPNDQGLLLELILQGTTDAAVARTLGSTPALCQLGLDILSWQKLKAPAAVTASARHQGGAQDRHRLAGLHGRRHHLEGRSSAVRPDHVHRARPEALPDGTPGFTAANQLMGRMARLCYDQLG